MKIAKNLPASPDRLKKICIFGILLLFTALFLTIQFGRLSAPPWDNYESWRQTDTYSIARNYVHFGMGNPFAPMLNYDGAADNYAQLELQIMPYLSAILFRLTGLMSPAICRLLSLLFFLGSAVFLFLLLREAAGILTAVIGYGIYLFLPLSMLLASSVQPESCVLFFFCGGVYFLSRYHRSGNYGFLAAASIMTAFAIMEKTPAAFVGLLFLYVLISTMGKNFFKNPWFYGCGAITLLPPAAYLLYSSAHSVFRFVDGIAVKHIFSKEILSVFTGEGIRFFYNAFTEYFGWAVIVLSVLGMTLLPQKKHRFLLVWTTAFALECATIVAIIKFSYYLVFILPICAALSAVAIRDILSHRKAAAAVVCAFAALSLVLHGNVAWQQTAEIDTIGEAGRLIAENVGFDESIAIGTKNPATLNAADRRGYRANLKYYEDIPAKPEDEIAYFIAHGVNYMVVCNGAIDGDDGSYLTYVREHFPVYAESEHCVIYHLTPKKEAAQ